MKKVLLLHPKLLFYKIPIYNKLSSFLLKRNVELIIWFLDVETQNEKIEFNYIKDKRLNLINYISYLKSEGITHVVNILNMSNPGYSFYFASIFSAKLMGKKVIFYGHGMNLNYADNKLAKLLYNCIHLNFDKIILYSPNEKRLLWKINQKKVSVAFNTLDLEGRDALVPKNPKREFKKKYNIDEDFIVLFSGRIQDRKKLNDLLEIFQHKEMSNIGLVIVGPGITEQEKEIINKNKNIHYLGAIYDKYDIALIFKSCNIFCIPGHIGLGLIEAFYWGLPVITTSYAKHAPEIFYLKSGYNGYLLNSKEEILNKIIELKMNDSLIQKLSRNAKKTYLEEASIYKLLNGFFKAIS